MWRKLFTMLYLLLGAGVLMGLIIAAANIRRDRTLNHRTIASASAEAEVKIQRPKGRPGSQSGVFARYSA
jgi:hypothetical protein